MTVESATSEVSLVGNGVTTAFPFAFKIPTEDDIKVYTEVIATGVESLVSSSDYTVTGIGDDAGGTVTYPLVGSPLASTHNLIIRRQLEYTQPISFPRYSAYHAETLEDLLDRIVMMIQQLAALIRDTEVGTNVYVLRGIGGTANAVVASTGRSLSELVEHDIFWVQPALDNTLAVTLAIDGLTAVPVKGPTGAALAAGEFNSLFWYGLKAMNSPVTELRIISEQ